MGCSCTSSTSSDDLRRPVSLNQLEALPEGVDAYYEQTFIRLYPLDNKTEDNKDLACLRPILQVLVAVQHNLRVPELAAVVNQPPNEVRQQLKRLGGLLVPLENQSKRLTTWNDLVQFNHKSVRDWLTHDTRASSASDLHAFYVD